MRPIIVTVWGVFGFLGLTLFQLSLIFEPSPNGRWMVSHVIDPQEPSSYNIEQNLRRRQVLNGVDELVFLLTPDEVLKAELQRHGFIVSFSDAKVVKDLFPTLKVPFYMVTSPKGEAVYTGAYDSTVFSGNIVESFYSGRTASHFPRVGCGTSVRTQQFFDPQSLLTRE